ncbi:MAG TPA: ABC transporter ATP-binding protein [Methylomusa anaerophila]|uniref:Glutathione import ATP-binding protein GsiA n=1 Tax=Methylomusa anaerophila TaxID=1930071 RepID=A0A348AEZ4_9FIRM|nr:ABC transporter ATP-binding protein [Methylomusa anaerophila]BBB89642.1 glutathione import ATP-binding protein GsiA [Methylomusa anaerophila]HML89582.1 ABC transporter ATP-binding protein [Methylomusa anaerophila]
MQVSAELLAIKNLTVCFDKIPVLREINLTLLPNQIMAVIGESGAGKTTLGLSILGLTGGQAGGEIYWSGQNLLTLSEPELRHIRGKQIAMVFQNTDNYLHPLYSIVEQVAEAILVHENITPASATERAWEVISNIGLNERQGKSFPHELSGGEKQRALIAMALVNQPQILILDEPTASLDPLTKQEILTLLKRVTAEIATILITHDLTTAAELADSVTVLYGGRVVETGPIAVVMDNPRHPYTRGLLRSFPNMTTVKDLQGIPGQMEHGVSGCPFHPRCTQHLPVCLTVVPQLKLDSSRLLACHRGGIVPLLEVAGLTKIFGNRKVVDNLSLTLYEGETLALVGESGSGKTTVAKSIMGLLTAEAGRIALDGQIVACHDSWFYQQVQMVFQNPKEALSHRLNVLQAIKEPLDIQRRGSEKERLTLVKLLLAEVELPASDEFLRKYPHQLSGGEAQRVVIARALALSPKILIADEPTSALDASVQAKIVKLLLNLQDKRGLAVLFITHDIALARKISDRLAIMKNGSIVEQGFTHKIINQPENNYTKSLLHAAAHLA